MKNGMGGSGRFYDAVAKDCASASPEVRPAAGMCRDADSGESGQVIL